MGVDKQKIENILQSDKFHVNEIKELVEERNLKVDRRYKDEMIEALLTATWTENQFENLKNRFARIQKESSPMGEYIGKVVDYPDVTPNPTHEELKERLLINEIKRDESEIIEEGFEVQEASSDRVVGIYWTKTQTFRLNALRRLQSTERTYDFGFEFDLEEDVVHIRGDNYGKLSELLNQFEDLDIRVRSVGHHTSLSTDVNDLIRNFVEDLSDGLESARSQTDLEEWTGTPSPPLLEIDTVEIKLTDGELKTANLKGREDIFENPTVDELTREKDGRIIHLRGDFIYKGTDFSFHVGLPDKLGRVRIKKKGTLSGDLEVINEAFDFLYDYFDDHFITE